MDIIVVFLYIILCACAGYGTGTAFANSESLIKWPVFALVIGSSYIVGHYLGNGGI